MMTARTEADISISLMQADGAPTAEPSLIDAVQWVTVYAAEAQSEAFKLLVHSEPSSATVWSEAGMRALAADPGHYSTQKATEDLQYYQGTLVDFRALHGLSE